jgi:hypothetical protein
MNKHIATNIFENPIEPYLHFIPINSILTDDTDPIVKIFVCDPG